MEKLFESFLEKIGEDKNREGLLKTPYRASKAYKFLTNGYDMSLKEVINGAIFHCDSDDMIIIKDVELYSLCEHHLLPFIGKCHIGYIPKGKIVGISKLARIVDMFSRRLQIQENLTTEIAKAIREVTDCSGVGVVIEANHLCMMMRGVEKQNSFMKTSCMLGSFREERATRAEFLSLIQGPRS